MKLRTSCSVALIIAETGTLLVLWQALRDATHGLQNMARMYADHRCTDVTVTADLHRIPALPLSYERYKYVPGKLLVQPAPMADEALARNPHTLGRP